MQIVPQPQQPEQPQTQPEQPQTQPSNVKSQPQCEDDGTQQALAKMPTVTDASQITPGVLAAVKHAKLQLSDSQYAALWGRMTRLIASKSCPPALKEKWSSCGSN
eukprot:6148307-Karenia_brevis.AAC.1